MKFPRNAKIEKCAAREPGRYAMHYVYLDIDADGARMVATDGRKLAVLPVEVDEHDAPGFISPESLAAARKAGTGYFAQLAANGSLAIPGAATFPRPTVDARGEPLEFPRWKAVIPRPGRAEGMRVSFNPKFLAELAEGLGSPECLTLQILTPTGPIKIEGKNGAHAALMPITVDG